MKAIKTIITSVMAFVWAFVLTSPIWFSVLMALGVGGLTYFAASCEEKETRCDNEDSKQ